MAFCRTLVPSGNSCPLFKHNYTIDLCENQILDPGGLSLAHHSEFKKSYLSCIVNNHSYLREVHSVYHSGNL